MLQFDLAPRRSCRGFVLALATTVLLLLAPRLRAQLPPPIEVLIGTRAIADLGHYYPPAEGQPGVGYRVYETAVATNGSYAVAVHISTLPQIAASGDAFVPRTTAFGHRIRYAVYNGQSSSWFADWLRPFQFASNVHMEDPCVVRGPGEHDFVVIAKTTGLVIQSTINAATGATTAWEIVHPAVAPANVDKPWMVRTPDGSYYLSFFEGNDDLRFFTATNVLADDGVFGADDWIGGAPSLDGVTGSGGFAPHVTAALGNVFFPVRSNTTIEFARLVEPATNGFNKLRLDANTTVSITHPSLMDSCIPIPCPGDQICGIGDVLKSGAVPTLVADPSDSHRLFLFLHMLSSDGGSPGEAEDLSDMDIQCLRLQRGADAPPPSGDQRWSIDGVVRVPHPLAGGPHPDAAVLGVYPDQFCLAAGADRFGRVHVLYYSNEIACGITDLGQRYDVYYAVAGGDDLQFTPYRLRTCTQRPPLDFTVPGLPFGYSTREYIGMAIDDSDAEFTYVTVTYSGTAHGDTVSIDPSAIYGQTIRVRN